MASISSTEKWWGCGGGTLIKLVFLVVFIASQILKEENDTLMHCTKNSITGLIHVGMLIISDLFAFPTTLCGQTGKAGMKLQTESRKVQTIRSSLTNMSMKLMPALKVNEFGFYDEILFGEILLDNIRLAQESFNKVFEEFMTEQSDVMHDVQESQMQGDQCTVILSWNQIVRAHSDNGSFPMETDPQGLYMSEHDIKRQCTPKTSEDNPLFIVLSRARTTDTIAQRSCAESAIAGFINAKADKPTKRPKDGGANSAIVRYESLLNEHVLSMHRTLGDLHHSVMPLTEALSAAIEVNGTLIEGIDLRGKHMKKVPDRVEIDPNRCLMATKLSEKDKPAHVVSGNLKDLMGLLEPLKAQSPQTSSAGQTRLADIVPSLQKTRAEATLNG